MIEQVPTQEYEILSPPTDGISTVKFAPNENLLLASSWDTSVRLYDPIRNEPRAKYNHKASVLACCFSDSAHAFSGGIDRTFKMYEINVGTETTLGEHDMTISSVAYSPSSNLLVTGSWDKTVRLWDTRTRDKCIASLTQPERVYTMDVSGNRIIVGTAKRNVWIWDIRNHSEPEQQRESSLKYQTRCIRAFIDGTGYSLSSVEGRVAIEYFDPSPEIQDNKYAFKCHRTNVNGIDQVYPVNCMAYHGIYGTFATGGCDGMVNIWDGANKKRLCQFHRYPTSISSMDFNHDGTLLAIASSYTYEEGEKDHPPDAIFVRYVHELEVRPKPRV
jgi:cell cycle arrest protein BUB3